MTAASLITGQSLATISDEALLQLLLRDDLPRYLNTLYGDEAARRMGKITPELLVQAPVGTEVMT